MRLSGGRNGDSVRGHKATAVLMADGCSAEKSSPWAGTMPEPVSSGGPLKNTCTAGVTRLSPTQVAGKRC